MEAIVFLVIMFLVGGVLQTLAKKKQGQGGGTHRSASEPQDILEAIRRAYEQAQHPRALPVPSGDESLEEMEEETETLEVAPPEVRTLERLQPRPERVIVDQDEAAEAAVTRRLKWAEARAKPISPADHRAFDRTIRAPEPAAPVGMSPEDRVAWLRRMVVWQEVLGPPKSLR